MLQAQTIEPQKLNGHYSEVRKRLMNGAPQKAPSKGPNTEATPGDNLGQGAPILKPRFHVPTRMMRAYPRPELTEEVLFPVKYKIAEVIEAVGLYYGYGKVELCGKSRRGDPTRARMIACYIAYKLTLQSKAAIGRALGNRDHTTIMHAIDRATDWVKNDPAVAKDVETITDIITYGRGE